MNMTIKEAICVLRRAGYKINEMAIERPSLRKERIALEKASKDNVLRVFNNILFGEEKDQGIGGSIFGSDFWNMCDKEGFSPVDAIDHIRVYSANEDIFRKVHLGSSSDLNELAEVMTKYYLRNKRTFRLVFYFSKMFIDELLTDEMADYFNFIEQWVSSLGFVSKCSVCEEALLVEFTVPNESNLDNFENTINSGLGISDAWHKAQKG